MEGLRKLGDPNAFAKEYYEQGIDELLYIDIVASLYNRNNLSDIVRKTVDDVCGLVQPLVRTQGKGR